MNSTKSVQAVKLSHQALLPPPVTRCVNKETSLLHYFTCPHTNISKQIDKVLLSRWAKRYFGFISNLCQAKDLHGIYS